MKQNIKAHYWKACFKRNTIRYFTKIQIFFSSTQDNKSNEKFWWAEATRPKKIKNAIKINFFLIIWIVLHTFLSSLGPKNLKFTMKISILQFLQRRWELGFFFFKAWWESGFSLSWMKKLHFIFRGMKNLITSPAFEGRTITFLPSRRGKNRCPRLYEKNFMVSLQ